MSRVIRDSDDDDDDFDVTSPTATSKTAPPSPGNNRVQKDEPSAPSCTKSTNGTESLRGEIQDVQNQLIGSNSKANNPSHPSPNVAEKPSPLLLTSPNKRRKTTSVVNQKAAVKRPERRKTARTYGSANSRQQFNGESSQFDALTTVDQKESSPNLGSREGREGQGNRLVGPIWDLPATIRDDFVQHEPVSMFRDASSTVPDNTLTQRRLLEEALSEDRLLLLPDQQDQTPSDENTSSIPWSAYLATQEAKSPRAPTIAASLARSADSRWKATPGSRTGDARNHSPERPPSVSPLGDRVALAPPKVISTVRSQPGHSPVRLLQKVETRAPSSPTPTLKTKPPADPTYTPDGSPVHDGKLRTATPAVPQATKPSRTKTFEDTPARRNSTTDSVDELSLGDSLQSMKQIATVTTARSKSPRNKSTANVRLQQIDCLPEKIDTQTAVSGPDLSVRKGDVLGSAKSQSTELKYQPKTPEKPARSKKRASDTVLLSDDLNAGLPTEQYRPRPSRSRSTQLVQEEPIDYSRRPEKMAKGKAKRRRTTTDLSSSSVVMSTLEKVDAIGAMGFSPTRARIALKETSGNVEQAIDQLVARTGLEEGNSPAEKTKLSVSTSNFVGVEIPASNLRTRASRLDSAKVKKDLQTTQSALQTPIDGVLHREIEVFAEALPELAQVVEASVASENLPRSTVKANIAGHFTEKNATEDVRKQAPVLSRRESVNKQIVENEKDFHIDDEPKDPPEERKRGRGRPKKDKAPLSAVQGFDDAATQPKISDSREGTGSILKEPDPRSQPSTPTRTVESSRKDGLSTPSATPPDAELPSSTPEQQVKVPKVQHSPITKGKPYRVGLSKRARIAPLLRTMKK